MRGRHGDCTGWNTNQEKIGRLEGLRGGAAILVVSDHAIITTMTKIGNDAVNINLAYFLGTFGVAAFFVISGLVMITAHGEDFHQPGRPGAFMAKRVARVVPLYFLATLIYSAKLSFQGQPPQAVDVLLSLLFIPHQQPGIFFGPPVYGPGWTLQYEMFFYLVFAACLYLRGREGLAVALIFFPLLSLLAWLGALDAVPALKYLADPISLLFPCGIVLGLLRQQHKKVLPRLEFGTALLWIGGSLCLTAAVALYLGRPDLNLALGSIGGLSAVLGCILARDDTAPSSVAKAFLLLGSATYSIYLTHSFLIGPLGRLAGKIYPSCSAAEFAAIAVPASALVGYATFRFVEQPLVRGAGRLIENCSMMFRRRGSLRAAEFRTPFRREKVG